jgi:hypothetical protein
VANQCPVCFSRSRHPFSRAVLDGVTARFSSVSRDEEEPLPATTDEFADRIFASALGAIEIYSIHIGDRLGLYRPLAEGELTL